MKIVPWISTGCCFFSITNAYATVTPIQELNFGTIVVTKNTSISSVQIDPVGNVQIIGGIAVIDEGNHAVYELSDLPVNRVIDVDVDVINSTMISDSSSEETFTFSLIRNEDTVRTNDSGVGILTFGGKIETSGNTSIRYTDTNYNSTIQITINL